MRIARCSFVTLLILFSFSGQVFAHCDTLSGPVVTAARTALKAGSVTPVLRWVQPQFENDVRAAFDRAIAVRVKGPEAAALADQWFFETVVRLHRQGEGEAFTGVLDQPVEPLLALADAAIADESFDRLKKPLLDDVAARLDLKFRNVLEAKKHAGESVEDGRRYVAAYVDFMHAVESLHSTADEAH